MQVLQSYGCIYVPNIMTVAAEVCMIGLSIELILVNLIADADENAGAYSNSTGYSYFDVCGLL